MPTYAELGAKLLTDSAVFFRALGEQNSQLNPQMQENARVFDQMAALLTKDPQGQINGSAYADMAGKLLKDAAGFFRTLGEQNEPIREQMMENANIFEQIGDALAQDPNGAVD